MEETNKLNPKIAALIVIVLVGAATAAVALISNNEPEADQSPSANQSIQSRSSTSSNSYKDGEYTKQGSYITPGGRETIGLTLTLKSGIVEAAELEQQASGGDTVIYQRKFASGYKAEVIGKNIDEVKLSRVAGSSLTSNGFNDALEQIKTDAAL